MNGLVFATARVSDALRALPGVSQSRGLRSETHRSAGNGLVKPFCEAQNQCSNPHGAMCVPVVETANRDGRKDSGWFDGLCHHRVNTQFGCFVVGLLEAGRFGRRLVAGGSAGKTSLWVTCSAALPERSRILVVVCLENGGWVCL